MEKRKSKKGQKDKTFVDRYMTDISDYGSEYEDSDYDDEWGETCTEACEGERFVYDNIELRSKNRSRQQDGRPLLIWVKRNPEHSYYYGIRANMTICKSIKSLIIPWHIDWLLIILYLAFAIYYYVVAILCVTQNPMFKFNNVDNYHYYFIVNICFAVSLTCTLFYFVFYSISEKSCEIFENVHYTGLLILVYSYTFVYQASELTSKDYFYPLLVIIVIFLIINIILI